MKLSRQRSIQSRPLISTRRRYRHNLAEQVFEVLQRHIVTGELRPNQRLVESEIAKRVGTSRTPVREALKRLELGGYVNVLSGGGLVVVDHSGMQIQSLFEIREALECVAIRSACRYITEKQINKAEEYYTRSIEAARNHDIEEYMKMHGAFHEELYAACGNKTLQSLIRTFRYQYFDRRLTRVYTLRQWRTQGRHHGQILEAVRERNVRRAEKALRRHLGHSLKVALQRL